MTTNQCLKDPKAIAVLAVAIDNAKCDQSSSFDHIF
jgi:hypothetical protein